MIETHHRRPLSPDGALCPDVDSARHSLLHTSPGWIQQDFRKALPVVRRIPERGMPCHLGIAFSVK